MRRRQLLLGMVVLFCPFGAAQAQNANGIIDPSRMINWSNAGVSGGIPGRTTQCGPTIAAYSGPGTAITAAIASCPSGQYVSLGAGTFNLSSGFQWNGKSNVTVRGQGASSTLLVFTGAGAGFYNAIASMEPTSLNEGNDAEQNACDWTAGYGQGATTITLANCGSTTPAAGSISNLKVGSIVMLDQLDEGADTGTIWNCLAGVAEGGVQCANNPVGSGGEARHDGTCNSSPTMCYRSQQQGVVVTSCDGNSTLGHTCSSGTNITISPGLYMPNWRSGQKPQAEYATNPITGDGLEAVSIDATNAGSQETILIGNCSQCYVLGVRSIDANRSHVRVMYSTHFTVRDGYTYENQSHATVSYGIEIFGGWDGLIMNNILQQNTDSEPSCSGACEGNVIAYNFNVDNVYVTAGWMQAGYYLHASGSAYNLWEGNIGPGYNADDVHGTHNFDTLYRNYLIGNQTAGCGSAGLNTCTAQTTPIILQAGARYFNIIGNVLGQTGFHNYYQCNATSTASCAHGTTSIYNTGYSGNGGVQQSAVNGFCTSPSCGATGAYDPQVGAYVMKWGNFDVVTNAVRWCGNSSDPGWSTTCGSTSEVPAGLASYSNPVPNSTTLPPSFFLSAEPSWWGSLPYPAIGPDVAGGSGPGGYAYPNPAQNCYANVMAGPANGTGGALPFNANTCYGSSAGGPGPAPAPPTTPAALVR